MLLADAAQYGLDVIDVTTEDAWKRYAVSLARGRKPVMLFPRHTLAKGTPKNKVDRAAVFNTATYAKSLVRPRCARPGCRNKLRVKDFLVCSETCRHQALEHFGRLVNLLRGVKVIIPRFEANLPDPTTHGISLKQVRDAAAAARAEAARRGRGSAPGVRRTIADLVLSRDFEPVRRPVGAGDSRAGARPKTAPPADGPERGRCRVRE